jgi:site-specific recombinase XerD
MDVTTIVTSMASLTRKPGSKFWFACFRDANGRQRRKSTKTSDRKKAIKIAEQYEQVGQRKMPARAVRETLAELYREIYNASVPTATVRGFVENWLKTKQPEISPATLAFYRKSTNKLLEFLGSAADLDLASVTRTTLVEFRNQVAQKASATTTNHDLRAIKALFREAKRDGYVAEDPSEFVDTVRNRHGRSANLSNHFADLLAQAGLRERAPHHRSKGKGRSGQRASNSLSFHSLRHTAVSLLKDAGIPEGVVMELVGHDSKSMSAHYTHVGVEALEKAVAALPEI